MKCAHSYYAAKVVDFLDASPSEILGALTGNSDFPVDIATRNAWVTTIEILKDSLMGLNGTLFLEFRVPRIGSRMDAVFSSGPVLFVIEFKVGATEFSRGNLNQVWDYALDLKNFHKASHDLPIAPILVATHAGQADTELPLPNADRVFPPIRCNREGLGPTIRILLSQETGPHIDAEQWARASYAPTPTIINAARALYSRHSVESIARNDAGARNLSLTSQRIEGLIEESRKNGRKSIIFVTGVPGAGKTLVGLNVATRRRDAQQPTHAVYLSGNGPLVDVLREALTRDEVDRLSGNTMRVRKGVVKEKVKAFIQNVHHFRDTGLADNGPPIDHVVIFDEAQRAWNHQKTADFMRRKKGRPDFGQSEPEFLIAYLDRHSDWAVVICLVGGGQEINQGEAGISAWLRAAKEVFPDWYVYVSQNLTDSEYAAGEALELLAGRENVFKEAGLHLSTSLRSFRAEHVSTFVKAVLDSDLGLAHENAKNILHRYPIVLSRDLSKAKEWIRGHARGTEDFGIVASSSALRLRPHSIDVRVDTNPIHWFLGDPEDTRSRFYMEDAATEFQVQGLELDWVCVAWDADLRYAGPGWNYYSFVGSKWNSVHKSERREYLRNAYRVLLTRARQGMVIFLPTGDASDPTRKPAYYDSTFEYLKSAGLPVLRS